MDVKKIGRIPDGGGWRAHGRKMGSTGVKKKARIGYDFVHSVVDDHSRYAYSEVLDDEKAATCAAFFERALARFATIGITVERVMTDNHWSYTHSNALAALLEAHDITHKLIKPAPPLAEREGRTVQPDVADRVGLPPRLHQQRRTHPGPCPMARDLQHSPPPQRHRRPHADQPRVTNLMTGYTQTQVAGLLRSMVMDSTYSVGWSPAPKSHGPGTS